MRADRYASLLVVDGVAEPGGVFLLLRDFVWSCPGGLPLLRRLDRCQVREALFRRLHVLGLCRFPVQDQVPDVVLHQRWRFPSFPVGAAPDYNGVPVGFS